MGTFQRTETVDARQFTGGVDNGSNLALWVNSNGQLTETRAEWMDAIKVGAKTLGERVRIRTYSWRESCFVGDWIILKQDGSFDHMSEQAFIEAGYVQV